MKRKKLIKNYTEYFLFRSFISLMKILPFKISRKILANVTTFIAYNFNIRRDLAIQQIKHCFPQYSMDKIKKIVKNMYANLGKMAAETYLIDDEKLFSDIETEGFENLQKAYDLNKGVVFASGHFGNWETAGQYIANRGIRTTAIVKKQRNHLFDEYTRKLRTRLGVNLITTKGVLKSIVSALKDGQMVALMVDQDAKRNGIIKPFLDRETSMFTGPARFAIKLSAPIVFGVVIRKPNEKFKIIFDKMISPEDITKMENPIEEITLKLNERLAYYVTKYPDQWFWVHNRWKYAEKKRRKNAKQN